jgi:hypothetical protein
MSLKDEQKEQQEILAKHIKPEVDNAYFHITLSNPMDIKKVGVEAWSKCVTMAVIQGLWAKGLITINVPEEESEDEDVGENSGPDSN